MLFSTEVRCICLLSTGIIADMVPNTAKHNAKAPVASDNYTLADVSCGVIASSTVYLEDSRLLYEIGSELDGRRLLSHSPDHP